MDTAFVTEAAKRGIFAYITDGDSVEIQSAIDIVLRRFADLTSPRPSGTPTCSCLRARTRLVQGWDRLRE